MQTWVPEFAQAIAEANRRAATLVRDEAEQTDRLRQLESDIQTLRRRAARAARAETVEVEAKAEDQAELWEVVIGELRRLPVADHVRLLELFVASVDSAQTFLAAVRGTWAVVERLGGQVEDQEALARAAAGFDRLRSQAVKAIECRTTTWKPKDPERFERGMREAAEGTVLTPDEVKASFRGPG